MLRRDFLKLLPALPALAEVPRLRGAKIKITDVRLFRTRVVRDTGTMINWVGAANPQRIGGTSFILHASGGRVAQRPVLGTIRRSWTTRMASRYSRIRRRSTRKVTSISPQGPGLGVSMKKDMLATC
jgi:hypothetical protein